MSNSGRIAKNTMYLYFRSLFVLMISLYTSRVVLRTLGVVDYGIYNVVGGVIGMLGFLSSNMRATYQRYLNVEMGRGNLDGVKKMFQASLATQVIIAAVVLLLSETVGLWFVCNKLVIPEDRMDAALWIYQVAIVSFLLTLFENIMVILKKEGFSCETADRCKAIVSKTLQPGEERTSRLRDLIRLYLDRERTVWRWSRVSLPASAGNRQSNAIFFGDIEKKL